MGKTIYRIASISSLEQQLGNLAKKKTVFISDSEFYDWSKETIRLQDLTSETEMFRYAKDINGILIKAMDAGAKLTPMVVEKMQALHSMRVEYLKKNMGEIKGKTDSKYDAVFESLAELNMLESKISGLRGSVLTGSAEELYGLISEHLTVTCQESKMTRELVGYSLVSALQGQRVKVLATDIVTIKALRESVSALTPKSVVGEEDAITQILTHYPVQVYQIARSVNGDLVAITNLQLNGTTSGYARSQDLFTSGGITRIKKINEVVASLEVKLEKELEEPKKEVTGLANQSFGGPRITATREDDDEGAVRVRRVRSPNGYGASRPSREPPRKPSVTIQPQGTVRRAGESSSQYVSTSALTSLPSSDNTNTRKDNVNPAAARQEPQLPQERPTHKAKQLPLWRGSREGSSQPDAASSAYQPTTLESTRPVERTETSSTAQRPATMSESSTTNAAPMPQPPTSDGDSQYAQGNGSQDGSITGPIPPTDSSENTAPSQQGTVSDSQETKRRGRRPHAQQASSTSYVPAVSNDASKSSVPANPESNGSLESKVLSGEVVDHATSASSYETDPIRAVAQELIKQYKQSPVAAKDSIEIIRSKVQPLDQAYRLARTIKDTKMEQEIQTFLGPIQYQIQLYKTSGLYEHHKSTIKQIKSVDLETSQGRHAVTLSLEALLAEIKALDKVASYVPQIPQSTAHRYYLGDVATCKEIGDATGQHQSTVYWTARREGWLEGGQGNQVVLSKRAYDHFFAQVTAAQETVPAKPVAKTKSSNRHRAKQADEPDRSWVNGKEFSRRLGLPYGTLGGLLIKDEKDGLIVRRQGPGNAKLIQDTKKNRKLYGQ